MLIWLPELAVQGEGETLEKAQDDLIDAVIEYVVDGQRSSATTPITPTRPDGSIVLLSRRAPGTCGRLSSSSEASQLRRAPALL